MRLYEFANSKDYEDVDMFDDLRFFMMEDPTVYRSIYYPRVIELKKLVKLKKTPPADFFKDLIVSSIKLYIERFKVPPEVQKRFTEEGITELSKSFINSELQLGDDNGRERISKQ